MIDDLINQQVVDASSKVFSLAIQEYLGVEMLKQSRIMQDFNLEVDVRDEYRGRELYELIQNADDQGATKMAIYLDTDQKTLIVRNDGTPFSEDGFLSIMRANDSTKLLLKKIGQKGLGFRSVLNWAKEIEIRSAGIVCHFSASIANNKWREKIIPHFKNDPKLAEYEGIARLKGRESPLAILAVPEVSAADTNDPETGFVTTIKLTLDTSDDSVLERVTAQMDALKNGRVLLFLPHLLELILNGSSIKKSQTGDVVELDGKQWKLKEEKNGDYNKVAVACPLDETIAIGDTTLYCFFPTKEVNPYPCIVHAAFRLDQSRNHLVDSPTNVELIEKCAELMIGLAKEMDPGTDPWKRVRMVYTDQPVFGYYQTILRNELLGRLKSVEILPVVTGGFVSGGNAKFVSPRFSALVKRALDHDDKKACFNQMLCDPGSLDLGQLNAGKYTGQELWEGLTGLSALPLSFDLRAELIKSLVDGIPEGTDPKPSLMVDAKSRIIPNTAYLIASGRIPDVPDWSDMKLVHPELYSKLLSVFQIEGAKDTPAERQLTTCLEKHLDVKYADKNTVIRKIVPSSMNDKNIKERVKVLFEYHLKYTREGDEKDGSIVLSGTTVYLLNKQGNLIESSKLVLHGDGIDPAWQLMGIEEWGFGQDAPEDVVLDFWHRLHVSDYLPMVMKDIVEDGDYLSAINIRGRSGENKVSNYPKGQYAFVPDPDFSNNQPLKSFMKRLLLEKSLYTMVIGKQSLRYYHWGENSKEFPLSYPAYYIQRLPVLQKFQGYVCQDVMSLDKDILSYDEATGIVGQNLSKTDYLSFLVRLGMRNGYEDFSVEELYERLKEIGKRSEDAYRGVMREYQQIRRALEAKKGSVKELERAEMLKGLFVFASQAGKVVKVGHEEAYYWDYDRLPARLSSQLPKLYIGNRVGADSVTQLFGVNRVENILIDVGYEESDKCPALEEELRGLFSRKIPYLLSVRCKNSMNDINRYYSALCSMRFLIFRKIFVFVGEDRKDLGPFEMINKDNDFYFCCPSGNTLEAVAKDALLKQVDFWENVAEAVCIKLDVRGDGMMSSFRSIMKGGDVENEYLRKKEIPLDVWQDVLKAIGMSEEEKQFWLYLSGDKDWVEKVANPLIRAELIDKRFGTQFSRFFSGQRMPGTESLLDNEQMFELLCKYQEEKPEAARKLSQKKGLSPYYLKQLRSIRDDWEERYRAKLYKDLSSNPRQQASYMDSVQSYLLRDECLAEIAERRKYDILGRDELETSFLEIMGIRRNEQEIDHANLDVIKGEYADLIGDLDESLFSNQLQSLLLFRDNRQEIERLLNELRKKEELTSHDNTQDVSIRIGSFLRMNPPEEGRISGGGGFVSEKAMKQAGKRAEDCVSAKLKELEGVESVQPVSRYSRADGIDGKHVDFQYTYNGEKRLLEVKSMSGNRIILSKAEYAYALKNRATYDFAIVSGDRITIWPHPFLDSDEAYPHSYELYLSDQDDKK